MLYAVAFRSEGTRYAEGHIVHGDSVRTFCGVGVPAPVLECGITDPKNPYVGKANVTCKACISEMANGRRDGFAERG